ncbi:hypothetical protein KC318_g701 [Hortaea werneckii]|nr:hypothetical protein KC334_g856 [Hortaea werneckii]KAI7675813.1 hypothetical protein KC318_g701 [Hortaea werneckii]
MASTGKRASRPPYSEQQKFFIAYMLIIKHKSWAQIGEEYAVCFRAGTSPRSKEGLTSVYYRVRKEWGLSHVNEAVVETSILDRWMVHSTAYNFDAHFLDHMGYDEPPVEDQLGWGWL